jgi:hypothetical protein
MLKIDWREVIGGTALGVVGAYFLYHSFGYGIGTPRQMGAGFFPMMLGTISIIVALLILVGSLRHRVGIPSVAWRPLIAILGGIALFGLTLHHIGLVPTIALTTVVAAAGDTDAKVFQTAVLAAIVSFGIWLIFVVGLNLPVPAFRGIF